MIRTLTLLLFLASCGRPLTENEQAFARTIMGETLNVRQARLHNGSPSRGVTMTRQARPRTTCRERILPPEKVGEVITTKPAAIALWNTVLFDKDWYLDDYLPDYPDRIGLIAAMHPGTQLDRTVTFSTLSLISVPDFLVATFLVLIFAVYLGWLPSIVFLRGNETGWVLIKTLAMPTLTLIIVASSQIIRMTRATVLNVMSSPYIEMAILKGVPRKKIILRHALLNAIGPIVNVIVLNLAWLVGGVVVVEIIFAYPGLAKLMVEAVLLRDLPLVQACAMIFCSTYVVLIFLADMASILSNPRLRHPK